MDRLAAAIGSPARLLVKRDDLTGLALGGNKARKLEYLCAEALERGCDTLVTGGGPQSNHARMTAAAANRLGLDCHLALAGREPSRHDGNLLLDDLLGATVEFTGARDYYEIETSIEKIAAQLEAEGRRPFAIPVGGASVTGVVAYALAIDELRTQLDTDPDWIFVADGSGGTHAGLLAGLGASSPTRVVGVDVGTRPDLDEIVPRLAAEAAPRPVARRTVAARDRRPRPLRRGLRRDQRRRPSTRSAPSRAPKASSSTRCTRGRRWSRCSRGCATGASARTRRCCSGHTGGAPALFVGGYEDAFTHES